MIPYYYPPTEYQDETTALVVFGLCLSAIVFFIGLAFYHWLTDEKESE